MESRLHGVPLSATQMAPKSGIRAPLTVDESDIEYSVSLKGRRTGNTSSYYSGSELESEGFDSGEDERETVSERVQVVEKDEGILEETHFVEEFAFSEPAVRSPGEEFGRESGSASGNAIFRPFVRIPDERVYEGVSNADDSGDSGSFLSESGDEVVEDESSGVRYGDSRPLVAVVDEEVSEVTPVVDVKMPVVQKLHVPIAQISADSDDDSQGSEVLDGEGFAGIVRIPSIEVLHRINSTPKVRISESDEGEDNNSQAENVVEMELLEDLVISNVVLSTSDEKEHFDVENSICCAVSAGMIQDKGPDIDGEATTNSLVVNEEFVSTSESGQNRDCIHLDEEIQETDVTDEQKKCVELVDHREPTGSAEDIMFPENVSAVALATEPGCICGGVKPMELEVGELGSSSNFVVASLNEDSRGSNTGLEDNLVFNHDNQSEKVESEHEIDLKVESFSTNAAHKISSIHQCVNIKEVPAKWCPEFPESPEAFTGSMQVHLSDSLSKDASLSRVIIINQSVLEGSKLDQETRKEAENSDRLPDEAEQSTFQSDPKAVVAEMNRVRDSTSLSNGEILRDHSQESLVNDWIVTDFHEQFDADGGTSDHRQIIHPAAVAAFFEAGRGSVSDDGIVTLTSVDGTENFPLEGNLADLGSFSSASPIISGRNSDNSVPPSTNGELEEALSEREKKKIEKIQQIRAKYLRLLHRLGCSPVDSVASKVLYQLTLAEGSSSSHAFHLNPTKESDMELEALNDNNLDFSLCILVIGKTGVGKSATINSIFGERKAVIDAFEPATTRVKEIVGMIDGVKLKVFDTPGLRTSLIDQSINRKILSSIKKLMQKSSPDIILYVDRLDTQTSNLNDLPLLKSVASYLGSSIWRKSIVAFTHGTSIPPHGSNGYPLSYEVFVAQQSWAIQKLISRSTGELLLMNPGSMVPVCLVENHPSVEKNGHGGTLLHNGESWRSQLLLLCYSMKTLSELSSLVTVQNPLVHRKRPPALSYFLSSFLQPNVHSELSNDQSGESSVSDVELCYSSDPDQEDDVEYDDLPPFKPLNKSQVAKLSGDQSKAYFEEHGYRIKLLQKKQLREGMRRLSNLAKSRNGVGNETYMEGVVDQETGVPETVAVPLPEMALPPSFGGDHPSFRYRLLESSSRLLTRPVLNSHGWDHDCGYDGVLIEDKIDVANHFPAVILVQLMKDKKEFTIQLHSSVSAKHGDKGSTMAGLDVQTLGRKLAYTLKGETRIKNFRKNETAAGVSIALVGENVVSGLKVENHFAVGKRLMLVGNAGVVRSQDDATYGVNLDFCRRDEDYPVSQDQTSWGLSIMRYRGDVICGCNLQSQFSIGRNSKLNVTAALNNKKRGQIYIKTSSSDQLQIAALALIPLARAILKKIFATSH